MTSSIWQPGSVVSTVANPTTPIQFLKGTALLPGITFQGDTDTGIWSEADGYLNFTVNGVSVLRLDNLGNLTTNYNKWVSGQEIDVASATTIDIGAQRSNLINITGTSNISNFGTTYKGPIFIRFSGVLILASSTALILPTGVSILTAPGDTCVLYPKQTAGVQDGWIVAAYVRASGTPISSSADQSNTLRVDVASASNVDLTAIGVNSTRNINITRTANITGFTVGAAALYFVRFAGALTLTNSASLVTNIGADRVTQAGDTCIVRATAASTVELLCYSAVSSLASQTGHAGQYLKTNGTAADWAPIPPNPINLTLFGAF
jgi:hypothetical protein